MVVEKEKNVLFVFRMSGGRDREGAVAAILQKIYIYKQLTSLVRGNGPFAVFREG